MSRWILTLALLASSAIALADPISFDEAVDGDLSANPRDTIFEFDFGDNVIAATTQIAGSLTGLDDYDRFSFVLSDFAVLSRLTVDFSGGLTPDSDEALAQMIIRIVDASSGTDRCVLAPRPSPLSGAGSITYSSCNSNSSLDWSDLASGSFLLTFGFGTLPSGTTGDSWNYTLTFTVEDTRSVPEPGTLSLLGVGLLAIGASRRRRKKT